MAVSWLLSILFFLVIQDGNKMTLGDNEEEFFKACPTSKCRLGGPEIRYPLRLMTSPPFCGPQGLDLSCSRNGDTLLSLSHSSSYKVTNINYTFGQITINLGDPWVRCPLQNLSSIKLTSPVYKPSFPEIMSLVGCSKRHTQESIGMIGPVSCLSRAGYYIYAANVNMSMDMLPFDCMVVSASEEIPVLVRYLDDGILEGSAIDFIERGELTLDWSIPEISDKCMACEAVEKRCAGNEVYCTINQHHELSPYFLVCVPLILQPALLRLSMTSHQNVAKTDLTISTIQTSLIPSSSFFLMKYGGSEKLPRRFIRCTDSFINIFAGSDVKLIAGLLTTGAIVILVLAALILLYIFRNSDRERETHLKVEQFLATYKTTKPTRYTFVEVKKMTTRFKHKLGQGGFGSVYKGELPNGIPVAVKMLEKSKGEGEEFINEVATIGTIHHVNVVRLLGFCSDRTRHALIYEFLPNESLDKYIYSRENTGTHESFCKEKLLEIAEGIARGIEYLHLGCDQRILHFDIKPHNILLDHDFNPKISDFGLAKLCSRDHSIITMTAARGTMGYIAPEMYSRNFGTVSYKSDVYSFGMLIMEMVGGRRNSDPEIENQNEVYFPEKLYEWIVHGLDLGLDMELNRKEEEIVKKLAIVALWCIQWNPADRPTMTRVIQMLTGDLQSLELPPKPFISSSDQ